MIHDAFPVKELDIDPKYYKKHVDGKSGSFPVTIVHTPKYPLKILNIDLLKEDNMPYQGETLDAVSRIVVDEQTEEVSVLFKIYEKDGIRGLVLKMQLDDLPEYPFGSQLVHVHIGHYLKERLNG